MRVFLVKPQVRMDGFVTEEIGMDAIFSNTLYTCGEKGIIILGQYSQESIDLDRM